MLFSAPKYCSLVVNLTEKIQIALINVPPKPKPGQPVISEPRGSHLKAKRRIIVGNVSKWIPPDDREDMSTHKWMLYVRG